MLLDKSWRCIWFRRVPPMRKHLLFENWPSKTRTKWQLLTKTSHRMTRFWCKVLKTNAFGQVLKVHLVPQGSSYEKTNAFWKATFENADKITTFDNNLVQNDMFLMKSLKNICFRTSLEGASGSAGFPRHQNTCFWTEKLFFVTAPYRWPWNSGHAPRFWRLPAGHITLDIKTFENERLLISKCLRNTLLISSMFRAFSRIICIFWDLRVGVREVGQIS